MGKKPNPWRQRGCSLNQTLSIPAPGLYTGRTVHVRFKPFEHRLSYGIFQLLVDIDQVSTDTATLRWLSHNRPGWMSFHDRDHGPRDGSNLRDWAEDRFASAGIALDGGPIRLLCFPRVLGYVFNPLSVWFGYRPDGTMAGVLYEVNNTFGEAHTYVAPASGAPVEQQEADKVFHVSPFFDVSGRYRFTLRGPGDVLTLTIDKFAGQVRDHVATLKAKAQPLTDSALRRAFWSLPLLTLKVITAIHWEALKLLIKGARYHHKPTQGPAVSTARLAADTPVGEADHLANSSP